MKRYIYKLMITLIAFNLVGCGDGPEADWGDGVPVSTKLFLTTSEQEYVIDDPKTDKQLIEVSASDYTWTASSNAEWCKVVEKSYSGNGTLELEITETNQTEDERPAVVTITLATDYRTINTKVKVIQKSFLTIASVVEESVQSGVAAKDFNVELKYNHGVDVAVDYGEGEAGWVTLTSGNIDSLGDGVETVEYLFSVTEYTGEENTERKAEIIFTNSVDEMITDTLLVVQNNPLSIVDLIVDAKEVDDEEEIDFAIAITHNKAVNVEVTYPADAGWVTLSSATIAAPESGSTTTSYKLNYNEYSGGTSDRVANIKFVSAINAAVYDTYTLTQKAGEVVVTPGLSSFHDNFSYVTNGQAFNPPSEKSWIVKDATKVFAKSGWTNLMLYDAETSNSKNQWVITPKLNPSGTTVKKVSFWWSAANGSNSGDPNAKIEVLYTTDDVAEATIDLATWKTLGTLENDAKGIATKALFTIDFSAKDVASETSVHIALKYVTGSKRGFRVDDFRFGIEAHSSPEYDVNID